MTQTISQPALLPSGAQISCSITSRSSAVKSGVLPGCTPTASTSRSASRTALATTSRWPLVIGSNDPANNAVRGVVAAMRVIFAGDLVAWKSRCWRSSPRSVRPQAASRWSDGGDRALTRSDRYSRKVNRGLTRIGSEEHKLPSVFRQFAQSREIVIRSRMTCRRRCEITSQEKSNQNVVNALRFKRRQRLRTGTVQ